VEHFNNGMHTQVLTTKSAPNASIGDVVGKRPTYQPIDWG
jgi:hypothetical protein